MSGQERELLNKLLEEIYLFRGEMKSFKEQTMERCRELEKRCETRQTTPETCTIGRSLKDHKKNHGSSKRNLHTTLTLLLEAGMLAAVILIALFN